MSIKVQKHKNCRIFNFDSDELLNEDITMLSTCLEENPRARLGLNFRNIKKIDDEFLNFIKQNRFSICNINLDILTYFSLRNAVNAVPVYSNVNDFIENKRRLIKRRFQIV